VLKSLARYMAKVPLTMIWKLNTPASQAIFWV